MSNDPISQDELDALLRGPIPTPGKPAAGGGPSPADLALLEEAAGPALESAWAMAEALLGQPVGFSSLSVRSLTAGEAAARLAPDPLCGRTRFEELGWVDALLPQSLGLHLVGLMMGGEPPASLDETGEAALSEAVGQLIIKGVAKLAGQAGHSIIPSPVEMATQPQADGAEPVVVMEHELTLGDRSGPVAILLSASLATALIQGLRPAPAEAPAPPVPASAPPKAAPPAPAAPAAAVAAPVPQPAAPASAPVAPVAYTSHQFPELNPTAPVTETRNIDLLLDVSLQVTVELGRTRKQIREVLALGPGSILELEKLAGEPVDVLVNGKLIARGEVVVIDEYFGVRITDIISPRERAQSLR